ncbi:tetratricopeptide repeat protein [Fimbriiglobus ruber]|uniref:Uncharacterized protein n=1 Tax=Fimbriiglobus ruber TaxID=1908690 RepID=A0A225DEL2_9BACT|nr:tetratricopeptide repeat protein [Fimbriiglobus ruber]OWK34825.1 hypothetical protein FRUB_09667 [Fimbriiglobus ruber]
MSSLHDRIAQFRKMATDDPDNELGHFRLGQLLMEDNQHAAAVEAFEKTVELSPNSRRSTSTSGNVTANSVRRTRRSKC